MLWPERPRSLERGSVAGGSRLSINSHCLTLGGDTESAASADLQLRAHVCVCERESGLPLPLEATIVLGLNPKESKP